MLVVRGAEAWTGGLPRTALSTGWRTFPALFVLLCVCDLAF